MKKKTIYIMLCLMFFIVSACDERDQTKDNERENQEAKMTSSAGPKMAQAVLKNQEGNQIGIAQITEEKTGVKIEIDAKQLPQGEHGFHIHEHGICEEPEFKSAGDHFNPTEKKHGFNHPEGPHAGDLPNVKVEKDGTVSEVFHAKLVTLGENEENSLLKEGKTSLIIHEKADDYKSQPAGDAGARIACGVIEIERN